MVSKSLVRNCTAVPEQAPLAHRELHGEIASAPCARSRVQCRGARAYWPGARAGPHVGQLSSPQQCSVALKPSARMTSPQPEPQPPRNPQ